MNRLSEYVTLSNFAAISRTEYQRQISGKGNPSLDLKTLIFFSLISGQSQISVDQIPYSGLFSRLPYKLVNLVSIKYSLRPLLSRFYLQQYHWLIYRFNKKRSGSKFPILRNSLNYKNHFTPGMYMDNLIFFLPAAFDGRQFSSL